jgi:hypothetical protein
MLAFLVCVEQEGAQYESRPGQLNEHGALPLRGRSELKEE